MGTMFFYSFEGKVEGFGCEIHGGPSIYRKPMPKDEVPKCPCCEHPICPVCANAYIENPRTVEEAREYLASCDESSGKAYCGWCGDHSEEFMLRFLELIGCPIPSEYKNKKKSRRSVSVYATPSVASLPDIGDIVVKVQRKAASGISGIIKIDHPTGEIWGYPEKYPEGWIVTIMYPHEI